MSYEGVLHKPRLPSNHFFYAWKKKESYKKKIKKKMKITSMFITYSQQILGGKLLWILIWML